MTAPPREAPPEPPPDWPDDAPPHDIGAERAVLGAMLWGRGEVIEAAASVLDPADFYRPGHQAAYYAIIALHAAGDPVDCLTVREWLHKAGDLRALGGQEEAASYLLGLHTGIDVAHPVRVVAAAGVVRDRAARRRGLEATSRAAQRLTARDGETADLLAGAIADLEAAAAQAGDDADPLAGPVTAAAFTARLGDAAPRRAVIPGCVHEGDRALWVGPEGGGKSTLGRQAAVTTAAGLHVFTHERIEPRRVLIIDLENPADYLADGLAPMLRLVSGLPGWDDDRLRVWARRAHMDVRDPSDRFRIVSVIRQSRPDLVVAGPAWKMARVGKDGWEAASWEFAAFWDRLVERFGFALWMETHPLAGQGRSRQWRPRGGEIMLAWPDFGLAMVPAAKSEPAGSLRVDKFRGGRVRGRVWPEMLTPAPWAGQWPWQARYPVGTLTAPLDGGGR